MSLTSGRKGGAATGPSPVDRGKTGSEHHLICDGGGIPLAVTLTGGNRNDITQLIPLLDAIPAVRGRRGRPRRKPDVVVADRGYDHEKYRILLRQRGIRPLISRRGTRDNNQPVRWVVEQTLALLYQFRRLAERWERRTDSHHGLPHPRQQHHLLAPTPDINVLGALSRFSCLYQPIG